MPNCSIDMHLGIGGMESRFDVFMGKVSLLRIAQRGFANSTLAAYPMPPGTSLFGVDDASPIRYESTNSRFLVHNREEILRLPILTRLFVIQVLAALAVASELLIPLEPEVLESFSFKENRLTITTFKGTTIIFDGEVTAGARMAALSDHFYGEDAGLVILQSMHGQEPLSPQLREFEEVRAGFKNISVIDSIESSWFGEVAPVLRPDITFQANALEEIILRHKVAFIHAGGWHRRGPQVELPFKV
jgi:hypothetical protein